MDFSISHDQQSILESVTRLLSDKLTPIQQRDFDQKGTAPYEIMTDLANLGLFGMPFPEQYGGTNVEWGTIAMVQHVMGKTAYMAASLLNRSIGFGGMPILIFGSPEQKEKILPQVVKGEALFALALSEPGAGSDANAIISRATPMKSGGWQLRGNKIWVSDAKASSYIVVACKTKSTDEDEGISLFLMPPDTKGLSITPMDKVGTHWMPSFSLGLDNVTLPETALLGDLNNGFKQLMTVLHYSRAGMASSVTGLAQRAVDLSIAHSLERHQFGKPIAANQVIRHRLVDMQMRVNQSRLIAFHLAWKIANGMECKTEASEAKIIATETLNFVTDAGMQILAGAGYDNDSEMQRIWRDARLYTFGEGSNEIQRNIIAKEIIC